MAKFTIKQKRMDDVERDAGMITIGTRSSCSYPLSDPMAAEEHCAIHGQGAGHFLIEDLETSVGTFVDGVAVIGRMPIEDGSEIIIGVTRIVATIDEEADSLLLTIKGAFYYDDKKDALDWSRKETRFGRFRPVSLGNMAAVALAVVALPLCFIGKTSDAIMEPGPTYHERIAAYHTQLATLGDDAQNCYACHDSFNGTPEAKCMACHQEDIAVGHHPHYGEEQEWEQGCVHCHIDHRGQGEMALIAVPAEESCAGCHEPDLKVTSPKYETGDRFVADVALLYNTFSHADHFEKALANGQEISCASCHKLRDERSVVNNRAREFVEVDYDACMACHAKDASADQRASVTFDVAWHGAETGKNECLECHTENYVADLKTTPHTPREYRFELDGQPHHDFLTSGTLGEDACIECHKNGAELMGKGRLIGRLFEHQVHSWDVQPIDEAGRRRVSGLTEGQEGRGDCMQCHRDLSKADTLGDEAVESFVDDSCADCHKPQAPARAVETGPVVQRTEFPHSIHRDIEGGCFACHTFPTVEGQIAPNPVTAPGIKDCTSCHSVHQNIGGDGSLGGGDCHECHLAGDPSYFGDKKPFIWKRHADTTFRHMSRGHREWTTEGRCEDCHTQGTWDAKTIGEVHIPKEDEASCRECHVEQKTRFHWR